jgi:hypothetical protein
MFQLIFKQDFRNFRQMESAHEHNLRGSNPELFVPRHITAWFPAQFVEHMHGRLECLKAGADPDRCQRCECIGQN